MRILKGLRADFAEVRILKKLVARGECLVVSAVNTRPAQEKSFVGLCRRGGTPGGIQRIGCTAMGRKELREFVRVTKVTQADEAKEVKEIEEEKRKDESSQGVEVDGLDCEPMGNGSTRLART